MRALVGAAVLASAAIFAATVHAQRNPHDDAAADRATADCLADPQCSRLVDKELARQRRAQAEYDAKPLAEKALQWAKTFGLVGGVFWFLWWLVGRPPRK